MLSVGCNGLEYFQWIDDNLGRPNLHIGLEFYLPQPAGLPENVRWIANTAGDMRDVQSQSVDLVFAGQTIEHLWYEELAGFFVESARVLKRGGRLLFDSPNRIISNALMWNHPEHTVELAHTDAVKLADLAGFQISKSVGHWLCRDLDTKALLPLTEINSAGDWPAERRIAEGFSNPAESFSWWVEARRTEKEVDVVGIYRLAREFSNIHFSDRISKMMQSQRQTTELRDGVRWTVAPKGWSGAMVFGPHAPLPPGEWLIRFCVDPYEAGASGGRVEVFQTTTGRVVTDRELPTRHDGNYIDLEFQSDDTLFALEFRLWSNGLIPMAVKTGVEIFRRGIA